MIDVHFWPTPNGHKVTILLEELGVPYRIVPVNIGRAAQFTDAFLAISPNNRMPALVDDDPADGGAPISIFESCAIMVYLAEKYGRFLPTDARGRSAALQWVFWQAANQGPKLGESHHFRRLEGSQGDQSYAVRRFTDEANRLYGVLNGRLQQSRFLAGSDYSLADMAAFPWTRYRKVQGQELAEFPHVKRWYLEIKDRPAVIRGIEAGASLPDEQPSISDEEAARFRALLYHQRARPVPAEARFD
jgi:GST-like protein